MADIYASIILNQVRVAIKESPNEENCYKLLKIFNPDLEPKDFYIKGKIPKLFKDVMLRIHPDKHSQILKMEATDIFQKLHDFLENCEKINFLQRSEEVREKKIVTATLFSSSKFPVSFNTTKTWTCTSQIRPTSLSLASTSLCFNIRGQIWYYANKSKSRNISMFYNSRWDEFQQLHFPDVNKEFVDTETIKEEISKRGPVISKSYTSPKGKLNENDYPIIMGWETDKVQGDVWIINIPSLGDKSFNVAFGTCHIEEDIFFPNETFIVAKIWEKSIPYLEIPSETFSLILKSLSIDFTIILPIALFMSFWSELQIKKISDLVNKLVGDCNIYGKDDKTNTRLARIKDIEFVSVSEVKIHLYRIL